MHKKNGNHPLDDQPIAEVSETDEPRMPTLAELVDEVEKLRAERADLTDQLLRSHADFQNFRKRTQAEKTQLQQFAAESLILDLIPVLDNFERTVAAIESGATPEAVIEGVRAVDRQFRGVLEARKLSRVPSVGTHFDPEMHEALGMDESEEHEEGTVTVEVEGGYRLADKVIRPARVRVAKKS